MSRYLELTALIITKSSCTRILSKVSSLPHHSLWVRVPEATQACSQLALLHNIRWLTLTERKDGPPSAQVDHFSLSVTTQSVYHYMSFASGYFFASVVSSNSSYIRSFHTLAVYDAHRRRGVLSNLFTHAFAQIIMDFIQCSVFTETPEISVYCLPWRQVV